MFTHYFKIAFRNLLKYRQQSIVSIIGLAMGFTCFALATLWIRYEMSYDDFHAGAERIYLVRNESVLSSDGLSPVTPYPLAAYLEETFPEIEHACNTIAYQTDFEYKGITHKCSKIIADSASMKIFPIQLLSGNTNFLIPDSKEIAITEELAVKLFGKESPLGKSLTIYDEEAPICAVVQSWGSHTNLPFGIVTANQPMPIWMASAWLDRKSVV